MRMKEITAKQLAEAYANLFPGDPGSMPANRQTLEETLQNWLKCYKESPVHPIATQNWGGKVTKALFKSLDIKMPRTKTAMLQALAEIWTREDSQAAQSQGWDLFEASQEGKIVSMIERCDEQEIFEDDFKALEFVQRKAAAGDQLAAKALRLDHKCGATPRHIPARDVSINHLGV